MWNAPSDAALRRIPQLCATETIPAGEKMIWLHFFFGSCDWYVAEYDGEDLFFGFAVLNDDLMNAEWGYFPLSELRDITVHGFEIDCDQDWQPVPAGAIERIRDWI